MEGSIDFSSNWSKMSRVQRGCYSRNNCGAIIIEARCRSRRRQQQQQRCVKMANEPKKQNKRSEWITHETDEME